MRIPITRLILTLMWSLTAHAGNEGNEGESVEAWLKKSYAPLWEDPYRNINGAIGHYAETIYELSADGSTKLVISKDWIAGGISQWMAEGWVSSHMTDFKARRINDSAYGIHIRWQDNYKEVETEFSCGWYLAGKIDGHWKFTAFAETDCSDVF